MTTTTLPVQHLPLAPFDSPKQWQCCPPEGVFECANFHAGYVQRSSGSQDDRILTGQTYFAKIHGNWFLGTFSKQWYGWSFNNWGRSGMQLNLIEDLYEVDLSVLDHTEDLPSASDYYNSLPFIVATGDIVVGAASGPLLIKFRPDET